MNNPLPWFKIEILQVADDLSDVSSLAAEGAYFRILRHLWLNGPQPLETIQRKCQQSFTELQHLFSECSTPVQQLFSIEWLERQRHTADEWRANKVKAGIQSALVRASKSKGKNRRSTVVEQPTSTSTLNSEKKERANELKVLFCNSELSDIEKVRAALPEIHAELVDLQHYSDIIRNWSDTKGEKRTDRGWLATFRQWIKRDRDESKLRKTIAAPKTVWNARA